MATQGKSTGVLNATDQRIGLCREAAMQSFKALPCQQLQMKLRSQDRIPGSCNKCLDLAETTKEVDLFLKVLAF